MTTPLELIEGHHEAYRQRDLETFMGHFSPNCIIIDGSSGGIRLDGIAQVREAYRGIFAKSESLNVRTLRDPVVIGSYVWHWEHITGLVRNGATDPIEMYVASSYDCSKGTIRRVTMTRLEPPL